MKSVSIREIRGHFFDCSIAAVCIREGIKGWVIHQNVPIHILPVSSIV